MRRLGVICSALLAASAYQTKSFADSEATRKKEPMSIGLSVVGENEGLIEANIGYSFSPDFELTLVATQGRAGLEQDFTNDFTLAEYAYLFGGRKDLVEASLRGRIFLGNSFSFLLGVGARRSSYELGLFDSTFLWYLLSKLKSEEIVGTVAIGNQWSFDNGFIFGIDWGFYTMPIVSRESVSYDADGLGDSQLSVLGVPLTDWLRRISHNPRTVPPAFHVGFRF